MMNQYAENECTIKKLYNLICTLGSDNKTTVSNFLKTTHFVFKCNLIKHFMQVDWFHNDEPIQIGSRLHTISDFGFVVLDMFVNCYGVDRDGDMYTFK